MDLNALIEALKAAQQNAAGQFEISEELIANLVTQLKKAGHQLENQKMEIRAITGMLDKNEETLKQQFDSMQIALVSFVMYKCGRKSLVIDSREIRQGPFTHIIPRANMLDGYRTQYQLTKAGDRG